MKFLRHHNLCQLVALKTLMTKRRSLISVKLSYGKGDSLVAGAIKFPHFLIAGASSGAVYAAWSPIYRRPRDYRSALLAGATGTADYFRTQRRNAARLARQPVLLL